MALLALESVEKIYRSGDVEVPALRGVSLGITQGEFVAITGSSGSGKSTLMNILGCLDRPTRGRYLLEGRDVTHLSRAELAVVRNRFIGFVFQSFQLLPRTSAMDNVELPLVYRGMGSAERERRARQALERVGLGHRLDHHPSQLSGGQQQRVAIARALASEPRLILADEPTGNLDTRTTDEILALFHALEADGITILLVTHEADVAQHAARIIDMRDGQVRSDQANAERRG